LAWREQSDSLFAVRYRGSWVSSAVRRHLWRRKVFRQRRRSVCVAQRRIALERIRRARSAGPRV